MSQKNIEADSTVIDTSCLIHLWKLELISKLVIRFNTIYIPRYVEEETGRKGRSKSRLKELIKTNDPFLQRCDIGNPFDVQLLYDRQLNPDANIDRGESEVIIQARERGISNVLIDDKKGKSLAEKHTLKVFDLLDILGSLKRNHIIDEVKPFIDKLGKKYRPKPSKLKDFLQEHQELD